MAAELRRWKEMDDIEPGLSLVHRGAIVGCEGRWLSAGEYKVPAYLGISDILGGWCTSY